jgi:hypothetical protein
MGLETIITSNIDDTSTRHFKPLELEDAFEISKGDRCQLTGLKAKPNLNGTECQVVGVCNADTGRYPVHTADLQEIWVKPVNLSRLVFSCTSCGTEGSNPLQACARCNRAYYCNAVCQRNHHRKHKHTCKLWARW